MRVWVRVEIGVGVGLGGGGDSVGEGEGENANAAEIKRPHSIRTEAIHGCARKKQRKHDT